AQLPLRFLSSAVMSAFAFLTPGFSRAPSLRANSARPAGVRPPRGSLTDALRFIASSFFVFRQRACYRRGWDSAARPFSLACAPRFSHPALAAWTCRLLPLDWPASRVGDSISASRVPLLCVWFRCPFWRG